MTCWRGNNSISAAQKLQQRRELAAQKRRERQLAAGTVTRNPAAGAPGGHRDDGASDATAAPVGGRVDAAALRRRRGQPVQHAARQPSIQRPTRRGHAAEPARGDERRFEPTFDDEPVDEPATSVGAAPALDRHTMAMYAERRSFNISGDGHGAAQRRVPDGRVRGFDEPETDFGVGNRRQRRAPEPEGVAELRRGFEAHGLADEFDPNEGRHPMEVAAERERARRIEAAAKLGPKAKRIAERPEAARVDASDKRVFSMQPGPGDAPAVPHRAKGQQRVPPRQQLPRVLPLPGRTGRQTRGPDERGEVPAVRS